MLTYFLQRKGIKTSLEVSVNVRDIMSFSSGTAQKNEKGPFVFIIVRNPGLRDVKIVRISFYFSRLGKKKLFMYSHIKSEQGLPCIIKSGQDCKFWFPVSLVKELAKQENLSFPTKIRVVIADALEEKFESNSLKIEASEERNHGK